MRPWWLPCKHDGSFALFRETLGARSVLEALYARMTRFKEQAQVAAARDMIALATIAGHARAHAGMALSRIGELTS